MDSPAIFRRLFRQNASAYIDPEAIPVHEDAFLFSEETEKSPLWHALNDGEDHELLFLLSYSVDLENFFRVWNRQKLAPIAVIGQIRKEGTSKVMNSISNEPFEGLAGYDHFK